MFAYVLRKTCVDLRELVPRNDGEDVTITPSFVYRSGTREWGGGIFFVAPTADCAPPCEDSVSDKAEGTVASGLVAQAAPAVTSRALYHVVQRQPTLPAAAA
ncbi:unnamed protein product, partial [Ectocarpus sp. 4 AP-2014]